MDLSRQIHDPLRHNDQVRWWYQNLQIFLPQQSLQIHKYICIYTFLINESINTATNNEDHQAVMQEIQDNYSEDINIMMNQYDLQIINLTVHSEYCKFSVQWTLST